MMTGMGAKTAIAALLIDKGAQVQAKNPDGETALHSAATWGKPDLGALLIKHGAKVDERDTMGRTPLMHAILGNNAAMVRFLLDKGASVSARLDKNRLLFAAAGFMGAQKMQNELAASGKLNEIHENGPSLVLQAQMYRASPEIIKMLKDAGAK